MSFTTGNRGAAPYHANDHHTDISRKYKRPETAWEEFNRLRAAVTAGLPDHLIQDFVRLLELKDEMTSLTTESLKEKVDSLESNQAESEQTFESLRAENAALREAAEKVDDADAYLAQAERARNEANDLRNRAFNALDKIRSERGL